MPSKAPATPSMGLPHHSEPHQRNCQPVLGSTQSSLHPSSPLHTGQRLPWAGLTLLRRAHFLLRGFWSITRRRDVFKPTMPSKRLSVALFPPRGRTAGQRLLQLLPLQKTPAQRAALCSQPYGGTEPDASPTFAVRDQRSRGKDRKLLFHRRDASGRRWGWAGQGCNPQVRFFWV